MNTDKYYEPEPLLFEDLQSNVIIWAKKKGILAPDNARNQLLKFYEEAGELASAELKNDQEQIIDAIGDVLVTLIIYSEQKGLDPTECLEIAYRVIKNRTGKTVNGTFIKDGV